MFGKLAHAASIAAGSWWAFALALVSIAVWAAFGPSTHYSDTWQLVANTGTTLVTFLMVFLIQNTQNRDTLALHAKIDELIRATASARNELRGIEKLSEEEVAAVAKRLDDMSNGG